ncbi:hypothetical protein B0H19DRAFT_1253325 [Mycena capillaripes]|nr:hypothetical protein B0H19DRAFT_1253325 [Mycena capillaripes]
MSTRPTTGVPPPRYETRDGSRSYSNTVPSSPKPTSEPRYVYYRVYTLDGMLHCKKKHGPSPFVGRIKVISVPPPHTVASLKRALVQAEGLPDYAGDLTGLFETRDDRTPMVSNAGVNILNGNLGATTQTAVALVFLASAEEPLPEAVDDEEEICAGNELPPLYYRLYNQGGEEPCRRAFERSEAALGCIRRESIAPPRNVLAVNRRIAKVEGKPVYQLADLFTDMTADTACPFDALVDDICGSSKENPVLIVKPEHRPGAQPTATMTLPQGIYNITNTRRPAMVMELADGKSANGTSVQAWANAPDKDGSFLNQLWLVQPTDNGYYSFRNPKSGTYMELWGGNPANSTKIVGFKGEGPNGAPANNQQWELIQAGGFYKIRNRASKTYANLSGGGSTNGTRIFGYEDTTGTSGEQDELWRFTLRSVALSDVRSALERNQHRLDDMHVISKDHIFLIQSTNFFSTIWRNSSLISQIHNSVFSGPGDMALTFKTAVTMWAAQNIKVVDISLPFGFVCGQTNTEAVNWTLHENRSSLVFLSPMTGYVVGYSDEDSSWGFL